MFATIADTLRDAGTLCLALLAIGAVLYGSSRLRGVKWVWRRLVSGPLAEWFRKIMRVEFEDAISEVKVQFHNNGGSTLRDAVDDVRARLGRLEDGRESNTLTLDRIEANQEGGDGMGEGA